MSAIIKHIDDTETVNYMVTLAGLINDDNAADRAWAMDTYCGLVGVLGYDPLDF